MNKAEVFSQAVLCADRDAFATALSPVAQHLAEGEGLFAHALSAKLRGQHE